jgi:hypothetical protein
MPYFSSTKPIANKIVPMLANKTKLTKVSAELVDLIEPMTRLNASEKTGNLVIDMLNDTSSKTIAPAEGQKVSQ